MTRRSIQDLCPLLCLLACAFFVQLFFFLTNAVGRGGIVVGFDHRVAKFFLTHATPVGIQVFSVLTVLGAPAFLLSLVIAVAGLLFLYRRFAWLLGWAMGVAGTWLLSKPLKNVYERPRPEPFIVTSESWSYPSAHAVASTVCYGLVSYFLLRTTCRFRTRVAIVVGTVTLVLTVAFSRVYLVAHYVSDVVGGLLIGSAWLSACITGLEFVRRYRTPATPAGCVRRPNRQKN